jgi:thiamine biosynthesis lipoprotein
MVATGVRRTGLEAQDIGFEFGAMACVCEVRLSGLDEAQAAPLAQQAVTEVRRIEAAYSRYRADSILSRINAAAGTGEAIAVDAETGHLLNFAAQLHGASDGLFDVTSGVLRKAWDFKAARLPAPGQIESLLPLVGWQQVQWNDGRIALPRAGMELDFGGIGKEYAADRAATLLQRLGARSAMVNLGGDIRLVGPRPNGAPWALGIAHPRHSGALLATMSLPDGALATSGDYERFFEIDGQRFCHVLNPHTGWPVASWQSVSVMAPACLAAGALTTIAMLKGDGALTFLDQQQVDYLAVDAQGRVHRGGPQREKLAQR